MHTAVPSRHSRSHSFSSTPEVGAHSPSHYRSLMAHQIAEELAKMADNSSDYVYLPIMDAKKLANMKVNLFAKVSEIGLTRRSKGTDYFIVLKIVDLSSPAQALSVNFFAGKKENLPNVKSAGDIICLHQVEMKIHNGDIYFLFNKRFSSFAVFDGKMNMGLNPYQTSANYHPTDYDNELLLKLRTLSLELSDDAGITTSVSLLQNIEMGKVSDLICKVLHVCETVEGKWMLFIWDGTDAPPVDFQTTLDTEKDKPSPLHPETLHLPREVLCSFPYVGTVMRVIIGKFFEDTQHLQDGDNWIKLCDVSFELQSGTWRGVMNSASRIFILSEEGSNVKYRKRHYSKRLASNGGQKPLLCFPEPSHMTDTDYEKVAYATLMGSITYPQVAHRCKCLVRVVAACPWRGEDLRSPAGRFRVRLTLEDPTARIHAYIIGEDGVKFFGGNAGPGDLTKKMKKLLGMKDADSEGTEPASRNPPWITCCLMSYYLDENDQWGSRRHKIYATRLLD